MVEQIYADTTQVTIEQLCTGLERIALLTVEQNTAALGAGVTGMIERLKALDEANKAIGWRSWVPEDSRPNPIYASLDGELNGLFEVAPGAIDRLTFARHILDAVAEEATAEAVVGPQGYTTNWFQLLHMYGVAVIAPSIAVLRDALESAGVDHVRFEFRDWPRDDDGEEIVGEGEPPVVIAPIDTDDPRFEEAGLTSCAADAEHATRIVRCDIDFALIEPIAELVQARSKAALAVLRGARVPA